MCAGVSLTRNLQLLLCLRMLHQKPYKKAQPSRSPRRNAKGLRIPKVALSIELDSTYGRDKVKGILAYLRRNPRWDIPLVNNLPFLTMKELKRWRGDGIIGEFYTLKEVDSIAALGIPMVNTVDTIPSSSVPAVYHDENRIGKLAAEHLSLLKRSVCLYFEVKSLRYSKKRFHFFQEEMAAREARVEVCWIDAQSDTGRFDDDSSCVLALKCHPEPITVFAASDRIALRVIRACHELNRKIPDEVAILGVGNDRIICQLAQPELSSIDQKTYDLGYRAAALLDQLMGRRADGVTRSPPPGTEELIVRGSSDSYALLSNELALAMQFIREHKAEPIYVPDVVSVSGVSRRKLEGLFHKYLGKGIYQEIRSGHISIAIQLLSMSKLSLTEICRRSGFNNVSALVGAIRQKYGCTARELRAKFGIT